MIQSCWETKPVAESEKQLCYVLSTQDSSYISSFVVLFLMENNAHLVTCDLAHFTLMISKLFYCFSHQHCTSAVRVSPITGLPRLAIGCVLVTFLIAVMPDSRNLREKGLFGVTVGEFSGCGGELEMAAHIVPTVRRQRLKNASA